VNATVRTRGLTKRFPGLDRPVVDDLDLEVRGGEVFGLLGPNGSGKSTILRMLVDLVRPSGGEIEVLGGSNRSCLHRVGALIEEPAFVPHLSGRRNLEILGRLAGVDPARYDEVLDTVGLRDAADRRASGYSTGMRQRLAIAVALLNDPDLVLLDEPTGGLDPHGVVEVRELIRHLADGDRTILLSSHLLAELEQVCDRVGVIRDGHLLHVGPVAELRHGERPELELRAEPLDRAAEVLSDALSPERVERRDGALVVRAGLDESPALNRTLVEAGIDVIELTERERSLEEAFLDLVGEDGR
jgi:ABC-2 type transport system ATP-binding protein